MGRGVQKREGRARKRRIDLKEDSITKRGLDSEEGDKKGGGKRKSTREGGKGKWGR